MVRLAKEAGCSVGFTTNGTRLDYNISRALVEIRTDLISFSFVGIKANTHKSKRRGSNLYEIFSKIEQLNKIKKKLRSEKPRILLLFMMLKDNMDEITPFVEYAARIKAYGVVATNLDYIGVSAQDDLKAFSCNTSMKDMNDKLVEASELAEKLGVNFKTFPLNMSHIPVCSEDPINNLYISEKGDVSPCVYLNPPIMEIPRIFCSKKIMVSKVVFGNVNEESLYDIWDSESYTSFRNKFKSRLKEKNLNSDSLPNACKTCYKAYGI
jgi:MoaA/NifB/PqqE/SkfB family radical SAM enzyme